MMKQQRPLKNAEIVDVVDCHDCGDCDDGGVNDAGHEIETCTSNDRRRH